MKFKSIKKIHDGRFIHRYDITYETASGRDKVYEMISRNGSIDSLEALQGGRADAVVLMLTDEKDEKILPRMEELQKSRNFTLDIISTVLFGVGIP